MGIFTQTDPQDAQPQAPKLFSEPLTTAYTSPYSPDQQKMTATLAALAAQRNTESNKTLADLTDTYSERISDGGEDDLRRQLSDAKQQEKIDVSGKVQQDILNGLAPGVSLNDAINIQVNASVAPIDYNALEKMGVEQAQDLGTTDPAQAVIMQYRLAHGNTLDQSKDEVTKLLLLQRETDKLQEEYKHEGWGEFAADIFSTLIPSNDLTSKIGIVPGNTSSWFRLPGKNLQEEVQTLWNKPLSQFENELPDLMANIKGQSGYFGENKMMALQAAQNLFGVKDSDALNFNVMTGLDLASTPGLGLALKFAQSPTKMLILLGNRAGAAKDLASSLLRNTATAKSVEDSLPSSLVPPTAGSFRPFVGVPGDTVQEMEAYNRAASIPTAPRLSQPQYESAIAQTIDSVKNEFKNDNILDIKNAEQAFQISEDIDTGVKSVHFYLGRKSGGGGYITEKGAINGAENRGLLNYETYQNADGQWAIKTTQDVREDGVATPELTQETMPLVGVRSQFWKNPSNAAPELFNSNRLAQTLQASGLQRDVVKPLTDQIDKIGAKSRKLLQTVLDKGQTEVSPRTGKEGTWYNDVELDNAYTKNHGRLPTPKERAAYHAYKDLSDWTWSVFNRNEYIDRVRRGVVTAEVSRGGNELTGRVNVLPINTPDWERMRILDLDDGVHYSPGSNTEKFQEKWESGRYRLVQIENSWDHDGEPVRFFLGDKHDIKIGPLERRQLGYVEGGSREYASSYYVKQAVKGVYKDGKKYYLNPVTHITATTQARGAKWAESMNEALRVWNDSRATEAAKRVAIELSPVENYDKWKELVDSGTIRTDTPFETLYDKGIPEEQRISAGSVENYVDEPLQGTSQYFASKGRMYYSARGDHLRDPQGKLATIIDPYTTLGKAARNATLTAAFGDYNKMVVDEWSRLALDLNAIDLSSVGGNVEPYNVFFNGRLGKNFETANPEMYGKLYGNREIHKRFLNMQQPNQSIMESSMRRFSEWVDSKGKAGDLAARVALSAKSSNPIDAVRSLIFDSYLGMFDPGQLIIQTQTALAAVSVHPVEGLRAMATLPIILWPLLRNRSESLLDHLAQKTAHLAGMETNEFKVMIRNMRNSKWLDVGGEQIQLDQYPNRIGGSGFVQGSRKVLQAGRYPFYLAEKINRAVAYQIAWNVVRKTEKLDYTTEAFINKVNVKADALSMNMTSASKAGWQTGLLSVPTQFMAYQVRLLENMLPKVFGGSPHFTAMQKGRLAIGQTVMYGAAGLPFGDYIAEKYKEANGKDLTPEAWRAMSKGMWDTLFYYGSAGELDTDLAHRAGIGASWGDFFHKLSDGTLSSTLETAAGATGSSLGTFIDSMNKATEYFRSEQVSQMNSQQWEMASMDFVNEVKSFSRGLKAYWVWKTGFLWDLKTGTPLTNATKLESVAVALGIPLAEETERWDTANYLANRDDWANEVAQSLVRVRRNAFKALEEGDDKTAKNYNSIATGIMQTFRDDPLFQQDIFKRADQLLSYSETDWASWVQKLYTKTGEHPVGGLHGANQFDPTNGNK